VFPQGDECDVVLGKLGHEGQEMGE
jgi:hypothetical protein